MIGEEFIRNNQGLVKYRPRYQYEKDQEKLNNTFIQQVSKYTKYIVIGASILYSLNFISNYNYDTSTNTNTNISNENNLKINQNIDNKLESKLK